MSNLRRQSILSSLVIYAGFAIGLLNTYFFTAEGLFEKAEYGLTTVFLAIAVMTSGLAGVAMPSFIYKFFPYYKDHLPERKNDMLAGALVLGLAGFALVMLGGIGLKDLVIRKYGTNSPLLVMYYYWVFPLGLGLTLYSILEAYAWSLGKPVLTNYFREVQWRLFTTVLIALYYLRVIPDFDLFIKLYSFTYMGIAVGLFGHLWYTGKIHLHLRVSRVTRRLLKKILLFCGFFYGAILIQTLSKVFDSFVIASKLPDGLDKAGIFALATVVTSIIQAPQRGIISVTVPHLSRAWKEKNRELLQRIYQRSSINQLIFACALFLLIWLNFADAILTAGIKADYLAAAPVFFILGLSVIIDMGTGVNAQIIITSTFWRFELISGILLLSLILPLTYFFTIAFGITGPAWATLLSMTLYNGIRVLFLWKKFRLFPFTPATAWTLLLAAATGTMVYFLFRDWHGLPAMLVRSAVFMLIYGMAVWKLRLTPDAAPVWESIRKRWRKN